MNALLTYSNNFSKTDYISRAESYLESLGFTVQCKRNYVNDYFNNDYDVVFNLCGENSSAYMGKNQFYYIHNTIDIPRYFIYWKKSTEEFLPYKCHVRELPENIKTARKWAELSNFECKEDEVCSLTYKSDVIVSLHTPENINEELLLLI